MIGRLSIATAALFGAAAFPTFNAPVVDEAGVIPEATELQLNATLDDFQVRTGHQIAVAVVDSTGRASLEDYSIDLAREWGVGDEDRDDGVLLLIAVDDRELRIEVGSGVEGDLTDIESGRIIREQITPRLRQGNYGEAVAAGVDAIRAELGDTTAEVPFAYHEEPNSPTSAWPISALVSGAILLGFLATVGRRRRGFGFGSPIFWGGGFGGGRGWGGGGFGGGGGGGFSGGGASGGW